MPTSRWGVLILSLSIMLDASPRAAAQEKPLTDRYGDPLPTGAIGRLGTTRLRQSEVISALAFLPDGKTIASLSGSTHNTIQLWDLATGTARKQYSIGHGTAVFSPDRQLVALLEKPGIAMFDLATGKQLYRAGHPYGSLLGFTVDGRIVATTSNGTYSVFAHDAATGKKFRMLAPDGSIYLTEETSHFILSPDGKLLVTTSRQASDTHDFVVWHVEAGKRLYTFQGHTAEQVIFAPDGKTLAVVASNQRYVVLREAASGKELHTFGVLGTDVARIAFAPDGKSLAIATPYQVHLRDTQNFKDLRTLALKGNWITGLAFSRDGSRLATATQTDERPDLLQVWQLPAGTESWRADLSYARNPVGQLAFSDDGATLALPADHAVRLWNVANGEERHAHAGHYAGVVDVAVCPDGRQVATVGDDGTIHLWDPVTYKERTERIRNIGTGPRATFNADTRYLMLYSKSASSIAVWDTAIGQMVRDVTGPMDTRCLALAPDGRNAAWVTGDGAVRVHDVMRGRQQARFITPWKIKNFFWALDAELSPDGSRLAATADVVQGPGLWHWDVRIGRDLPRLADMNRPVVFGYAPDSRVLAGIIRANGHGSGTELRLWETLTGKECRSVECLGETGLSLTFAADGCRLAMGFDDGSIRVWDWVTGKQLARFTGHRGSVSALRFSLDGKALFSGSSDTTVLIWDMTRVPLPAGPPAVLDACWADLAAADAPTAFRAVGALVGDAKQAVPFLRDKLLAPIAPAGARDVGRWIAELDSDDFETRDAAFKALALHADLIEPGLRMSLKSNMPLETRRRVELLLKALSDIPPQTLRRLRAVQTLELIGNAEARAALGELAKGIAGARMACEALESLERLNKRTMQESR